MFSKHVTRLSLVAALAALSACAHEETPAKADAVQMDWQSAVNLVFEGKAESAAQTHDGSVTFKMKNGETILTQTPTMDEIMRVKKTCGARCADLAIIME